MAGWYSTYLRRVKEEKHYFDMETLTTFTGSKLLCLLDWGFNSKSELKNLVQCELARMSSSLKLKLLALGVCLNIAAGPFTTEAASGELVARHLAIVIDVKLDPS